MPNYRILVVEDDSAIREGIVDALTFEGYQVLEADDGDSGMAMGVEVDCDLILLDLVLPGPSGLDILRSVRATRPTLPVIVLTALGEERDRVMGLNLGADDYVVKPFSVKELLARVKAVLRRSPERPLDVTEIPVPGGCIDLARCEIRFEGGDTIELSERESALLRYLAMNAGRAISRREILQRVWRLNPNGLETRTIDMHIARIRDKLKEDRSHPTVIRTVRGKGYVFGLEVVES